MITMISGFALTLSLMAMGPPQGAATGDTVAPEPAAAPAAVSASGAADGASAVTAGGLPRRPPPPRTMAAHWPVFALFAASWIGIALYLLATGRRSTRLADALRGREVRP